MFLVTPIVLVAIAWLAGHGVLHALSTLPERADLWPCIGVLVVFALAACRLRSRAIRSVMVATLAATAGFAHAAWYAQNRLDDRWPRARNGEDVELIGAIGSLVERRVDGWQFTLDVMAPNFAPRHVEITWYDAAIVPQPGERWRLRVRLRAPHGFANPGGSDYEARLLREDIGATGYVRESQQNRREAPARGYWVLRTRAILTERIGVALRDAPMLGVVQGLAVGDTSNMTSEQWRVFARTGTTHLMAISGMHIGIVALWIAWLMGRAARRLPLQRAGLSIASVQAIVGMASAVAYSALAGFSVPTQRTVVMLCVFFVARLLRREVTALQGLALASIVVLLIDPFAPLAAGFWLSFGAVGALFLATAGVLESRRARWREFSRAQWAATIGLAPLIIAVFGNLSLVSPLANLIAVPFFTLLLVPLTLIGAALVALLPAAGAMVLQLPAWLLDASWPAFEWAASLPLALWSFPQLPLWALLLLLMGALFVLAPGLPPLRFAGALLCLPALAWQPLRPALGEFALAAIDVGQGLAVVVQTQSHTLLYDTGPVFRSGRDAGELAVVPYLRARGVRHLDAIVVSHGDADHVGGLDSVLQSFTSARLLLGPSVTDRAASERCVVGQSWSWDGVRFDMLYPSAESQTKRRRNDSSCVLRIVGAGGSAILLGDIERKSEEWLATQNLRLRSDIALVPHHGSRTSSTEALVAAIAPRYAIVSVGFGNQWGFPKPDVVARWEAQGARILQTDRGGAIEVTVTTAGVNSPQPYRERVRRYWR